MPVFRFCLFLLLYLHFYDDANRLTQIARGSATVSLAYDNVDRQRTSKSGLVLCRRQKCSHHLASGYSSVW